MKKVLLFFPFLLLWFASPTQAQLPDSLKACLDSAITHAKAVGLYRLSIPWDRVEEEVFWRAGFATDIMELRPVFQYLLEQLHDSHGRFFFHNQPIAWYQGEVEPYQQNIDPRVWGVIQSGKYPFQYAMLPGNTGYLRLPGMPMGDNAQLAEPIRKAVCFLLEQGARQWVIDLRYNGGGNMFPMLAGISNILGDGEVGGSMEFTGQQFSTWTIKDADVYYSGRLTADVENKCPMPDKPKVAVLTSRYTVSSGEIVAVAFKGRPNTRFFGEHTAGFTTELSWQQLPAGVQMSIAVSFFADRQGRVYKEYVDVDEPSEFVPDTPIEKDETIRMALEWLNKP